LAVRASIGVDYSRNRRWRPCRDNQFVLVLVLVLGIGTWEFEDEDEGRARARTKCWTETDASCWPHPNLFRLLFAQSQMVAANFDFHWITEGREANQFDRRADEHSHLQKASSVLRRNFDLGHRAASTDGQRTKGLGFARHGTKALNRLIAKSLNRQQSKPLTELTVQRFNDGFDNDALGQLRTDAQTGIANLTDDVCVAANQFDLLLFAKTKFTEPMRNLRWRGKLFDPHGGAGHDAAQWAEERLFGAAIFA